MSFFCFFSPTSHHLNSPFAKIQRFSLRLCNSVALDIRFRPSSCRQCDGYGDQRAKNPKRRRHPSGRFDGSVVRVLLFEGSEGSSESSFLGVETSSFSRFFCYLLSPLPPPVPPKKGLFWVTQQLPDQDQACHLRVDHVDHVDHVDDIQELEGLTIYFPSLDCTSL